MEKKIEEILERCWKKSDSLEDTKKRAAKEINLLMMEEKGNSKYKSETIRLADELGFLIRLNEEIKTAHFGEGVSFNLSQIHRMIEHRKKELNTQISEINKEIDSLKKLK